MQAMRQIWEVMKLLVEPSGAVSYAAIVEGRLRFVGREHRDHSQRRQSRFEPSAVAVGMPQSKRDV